MVRVTCRDIAFLPVDTTYIIGTGFSSISSSNWRPESLIAWKLLLLMVVVVGLLLVPTMAG